MADAPEPRPQPPLLPRPVIPIDPAAAAGVLDAEVLPEDAPAMAIAEPGVVTPPPFAQVYSAPPATGVGAPSSMTMSPPPAAPGYYPPPFTPPPAWPAAPPARVGYRTADAGAHRRPNVITSLAVTGIVAAVFGLIASAFSGCTAGVAMGFALEHGRSVTVNAPGPANSPAAPTPALDALDDADRAAVVEAIRGKSRRPLSAAHQRQLDAFLAQHGQRVFTPPPGGLTVGPVSNHIGGFGLMGGADVIIINQGPLCPTPGMLTLYDQNAFFQSEDHATELRSVAGNSPAPPPAVAPGPATAPIQFQTPPPFRAVPLPAASYTLAIISAGVGGLLAIFLLVISILALRRGPLGGRRLLLIFVAVKIPCGLCAAAAFCWMLGALPRAHILTGPTTAAMTFAALGLIYPVAATAALYLNKTVRDYYAPPSE